MNTLSRRRRMASNFHGLSGNTAPDYAIRRLVTTQFCDEFLCAPRIPGYACPSRMKLTVFYLFAPALAVTLVACREKSNPNHVKILVSTNAAPRVPAHTNRLAREKSPYLLQHAHNPVDWFAW